MVTSQSAGLLHIDEPVSNDSSLAANDAKILAGGNPEAKQCGFVDDDDDSSEDAETSGAFVSYGHHRRRISPYVGAIILIGCGVALLNSWRVEFSSERWTQPPIKLYSSQAKHGLNMPDHSRSYDGIVDVRHVHVKDDHNHKAHVFVIGDWGAPLDGHVAVNSPPGQHHVQFQVAAAMKRRAELVWGPHYILNTGDNFYLSGLPSSCNDPPKNARWQAKQEFEKGWTWIYGHLSHIPWLTCFGNHDYGGWQFGAGWPQQVGYSFVNHNWIMPAHYWSKKIRHSNFVIEYFITDSNAWDAKDPGLDPQHNICGKHNGDNNGCWGNQAMTSKWDCKAYFWKHHHRQQRWLKKKLRESKADWQVVITHFPCEFDKEMWKTSHEFYGLDLVITGHRHQQELWNRASSNFYIQNMIRANPIGNVMCIVSGGGGAIVYERLKHVIYDQQDLTAYGFFDLTISKHEMRIEMIDRFGQIKGDVTIHPRIGLRQTNLWRRWQHSSRRRGYLASRRQ